MEKLSSIVKEFTGNVLCIGVQDSAVLKTLERNSKASVYMIDRTIKKGIFSKRKRAKMAKDQKGKKINMKKLRKTFKKKSVDYIVCDINEIYDYFKYFLYDSVVINKKKLYLYGNSKYIDPHVLAKRFERYHASTTVTTSDDTFMLVVEQENSKGNWLKAKFYIIIDTFHNLGDMISAALIS